MKQAIGILIFIVALCVTAGLLVTGMNAANPRDAYEVLEKSLQSGTTLQKANIVQLRDGLRLAIRQHGDIAVPIFRVAVLLRCRRYAVADSNLPSAASVHPRADILALLRVVLEEYPERAAEFISDGMNACSDVRVAAEKVVLEAPATETEYPGLIPVPWEPDRNVFTPVTPVQD